MKITSTIFVFLTVILATVLAHCQVPDVPQEVRIAAGMALAASNTDGIHEEAFKWGKDKYGNVLVSMSTPGKPCFTEVQKVCLSYFGAANPEIDARLVTVDGFAHVHPRGNAHMSLIQPPSKEDLYFAAGVPGTINLVIGAGSHLVYFYDGNGVTGTEKVKDFLNPKGGK